METEKSTTLDVLINALKHAATELEELQVQLALGKADARDEFIKIRKKFREFLQESSIAIRAGEVSRKLRNALEELEVQLALGSAETKERFAEQKKKINAILHEIDEEIDNTVYTSETLQKLRLEIKKMSIKLDIIMLSFEPQKAKLKEEFMKRKAVFDKKLAEIKATFQEKEAAVERKWEHFTTELSHAYTHLKNIFA